MTASPHGKGSSPTAPPPLEVAFIGCGAVGRTLGRLWREAGISVGGVCCTTAASAEEACRFIGAGTPAAGAEGIRAAARSAPVVVLAVPDDRIPPLAEQAAPALGPGRRVLHLSGALSSLVLAPCRERGAAVGSMHPLQSFPDPEAALGRVAGAFFACEGDPPALEAAFRLAEAAGGRPVRIETAVKPLYHAAAAAASNFMIPALTLAADLMEAAGFSREEGLAALRPLVLGTAEGACSLGVPRALTGPIERGDVEVVRKHREEIARHAPALLEGWRTLARMTVEAARRKGSIDAAAARRLEEAVEG